MLCVVNEMAFNGYSVFNLDLEIRDMLWDEYDWHHLRDILEKGETYYITVKVYIYEELHDNIVYYLAINSVLLLGIIFRSIIIEGVDIEELDI